MAGTSDGREADDEAIRTDRMWLGPVAGLAVLAALGIVFYAVTHPRTKAPAVSSYLLDVTATQIAALRFQAQGKTLTLYQTQSSGGATWTIGGGAQADQSLVQTFVGNLTTLTADRTLTKAPTAADLQSWGLAPPTSILTVERTGGAASLQLKLGVQSPVGDYYTQVGQSPTVYLVGGTVASEISANPSAWLPPPAASGSASSGTSAAASSATPAGSGTSGVAGSSTG